MPKNYDGRQVHRVQYRRGRTRHLQGLGHPAFQSACADRGHGDRRLYDGREGGYNYVHGEIFEAYERMEAACEEALAGGLSWQRYTWERLQFRPAQPPGLRRLRVRRGDRAAGIPRRQEGPAALKPPFPANYGLYGKPTTINNTETFASIPYIIREGGQKFLELGRPNNGGTKLFSCPAT